MCHSVFDPVEVYAIESKQTITEAVRKLDDLGVFSNKKSTRGDVVAAYRAWVAGKSAITRMYNSASVISYSSVIPRAFSLPCELAQRMSTVGQLYAHLEGSVVGLPPRHHTTTDDQLVVVCAVRSMSRLVGLVVGVEEQWEVEFFYVTAPGEVCGTLFPYGSLNSDVANDVYLSPSVVKTSSVMRRSMFMGVPANDRYPVVETEAVFLPYRFHDAHITNPNHVRVVKAVDGLMRTNGESFCRWDAALVQYVLRSGHDTDLDVIDELLDHHSIQRALNLGRISHLEAKRMLSLKSRVSNRSTEVADRSIELRRGLTVSVDQRGYVWTERNRVLFPGLVVIEKVYRGNDGRTRHRGYVLIEQQTYRFDTKHMRARPAAVIESALLRGGIAENPPTVDPVLLPHIVDLAVMAGRWPD
jgi:hypothetical protein